MTKDQLLIPRYQCTWTPGKPIWPGSLLMSGDILTARFDNYGEDYYYTASCDSRYGKELNTKYPETFEGQEPMPKECGHYEDGW